MSVKVNMGRLSLSCLLVFLQSLFLIWSLITEHGELVHQTQRSHGQVKDARLREISFQELKILRRRSGK